MRVTFVEREICTKINVGGYETLEPTVRMRAELEEGDDPDDALAMLDTLLDAAWNKMAIQELRSLAIRRREMDPVKDDKVEPQMRGLKALIRGEK